MLATFGAVCALILWMVSATTLGLFTNLVGQYHSYGQHSRAQVALAFALSCLSSTWVVAEVLRGILSWKTTTGSDGEKVEFELVPTTYADPKPEVVGAARDDVEHLANAGSATLRVEGTVCGSSGKEGDDAPSPSNESSALSATTSKLEMFLHVLSQDAVIVPLRAVAEMSAIVAYMYICDRTDVFASGRKVYDRRQFWGTWAVICMAALLTMTKLETSKPLQREQTDEWKGWMQIMFLMYHYFAEKEVYNAIRVYIAAYVFMTGFGNFSLYRKGKSFTMRRTVQMFFRLNFLGFVVCIALNNEYMLYYICAMHTLFTVFVLVVMYITSHLNDSTWVIYVKLALTLVVTIVLYDGPSVIFHAVFGTLPVVRPLFAFHDPLHPEFTDEMHEFHFRSGLDRFVWIFGMLFAFQVAPFIKFLDWLEAKALVSRGIWSGVVALILFAVTAVWASNLFLLEKYTYNRVHPYTSFLPITIYLLLRNLVAPLRERYLWLFAYMGKYTLETYILQFHIWMKTTGINGSPKSLIVWIPDSYFVNLLLTTVVYVFLSIRMFNITITMRDALIPEDSSTMFRIWAGCAGAATLCWIAAGVLV